MYASVCNLFLQFDEAFNWCFTLCCIFYMCLYVLMFLFVLYFLVSSIFTVPLYVLCQAKSLYRKQFPFGGCTCGVNNRLCKIGLLTRRGRGDLGLNPYPKLANCCCLLVHTRNDSAILSFTKLLWFLLLFAFL